MRPYEELTPTGKARRLRAAAREALREFGVSDAELRLLSHQEVTSFRVRVPEEGRVPPGPYEPGVYLLKLDATATNTVGTLESMMAWIEALSRDTSIPVPVPIRTRRGSLSASVTAPGVPGAVLATLQRWIRGRQHHRSPSAAHYDALGALMAELHEHARTWTPPAGFVRRAWDLEGILRAADQGLMVPGSTFRDLLDEPFVSVFEAVADRVREAMETIGRGPDDFGMIHADLHLWNIVFAAGRAAPVDFNDCGPGFLLYDLAVPIEHALLEPDREPLRNALLRGYWRVRPRSVESLRHLDTFVACRTVGNAQWAAGEARRNAAFQDVLPRVLDRALRLSQEYLRGGSPITSWVRDWGLTLET